MVTIRKRHDGRYEARPRYQGRRYSICGRTEAEVRTKLAELERKLALDQPPPPGTCTVGELVTRWLETEQKRWKPRTFHNYQVLYQRHIAPVLGPVRLSRLTPDRLQRFFDGLVGERTPAQVYSLLHRCFAVAVRWGYLAANPCERIVPPVYQAPRVDLPPVEDIRRLYQHCLVSGDRFAPLVGLTLLVGWRLGEALALRWSDVDLVKGLVTIRRSGQWLGDRWVETDPKTAAGRRTVPLGDQGVALLRRQKAQVAALRLRAGPAWAEHDLVFPSSRGTPLAGKTVLRAVKRLCREAGLAPLTFHQLRHASASLCLGAGVPLTDVQQRLGHATPAITMRIYAHALGDGRTVAERLEQLLG